MLWGEPGRGVSAVVGALISVFECTILESLRLEKRVKGSHQLFRKAGVEERINLQRDGNHAKPYQVKQVRAILLRCKLVDVE